jgi:glycosyltransferase involved in cell wall biosynthesis
VFNRESLLPRTLESVIGQTYGDFELLVVDNMSSDGTLAVANEYASHDSRIEVIPGDQNIGPVRNWLRGAHAASGHLIKFLFSDDWMDAQCLEAAVTAFESHPEIAFAYFAAAVEGQTASIARADGLETTASFIWRSLVSHGDVPVSPTAAMFRRDDVIRALSIFIDREKGFDHLGTGAGYDQAVYLEAAARYAAIYYIGSSRVYYGSGPQSITISVNKRRPGYLMWGYLQGHLAFLDRRHSLSPRSIFMRLAVYWHLLKVSVRHGRALRGWSVPEPVMPGFDGDEKQ